MATQINPEDVHDWDEPLNTTPDYSVTHVFSTDDILGTFSGYTQGDVLPGGVPVIDFDATPISSRDGVDLYPINSEFSYIVTDFDGAVEKDFVLNPEYEEGYAGNITDAGGEQIGITVSNVPTDTFKTPAVLGTWLSGLGGNSVKASTEHYSVMQQVLSDQRYPGDPDAVYPLDDELRMIGGEYDGLLVETAIAKAGDVNGDGVMDIRDVLEPNESSITENIAASSDYSVTLKDDGKLLYRWGNMIKKPTDIRISTELDLPEEWKSDDSSDSEDTDGPAPLYRVTQAELIVHHTITNNPNDQIRPEDYENESAIGTLPTYEIDPDGRWVSTDDYYAGDGTLYPAGTVLRDPALAEAVEGSTLDRIGATSEDLELGFTNAWYTTMDREPFEPDLNEDGTDYDTGPRWRLKPDKYGQDLPSVVIPIDPSAPPPPKKGEEKYIVGAETQTVINLLDWEQPVSPLSVSLGWLNGAGTVTANGQALTDNFDVAFYIKGDVKPADLYSAELRVDYDEITIYAAGESISGTASADYLVGQGNNVFSGGAGADLFAVSYGTDLDEGVAASTISDFEVGTDTLGFFDLGVTAALFDTVVSQSVGADGLSVAIDGTEVAVLEGVTETLGLNDVLLLNTEPYDGAEIIGTELADYLVGNEFDNVILGLAGNDTIIGRQGDDTLDGGTGNDLIDGRDDDDVINGGIGNDQLIGGIGDDVMTGGDGLDKLAGQAGDDTLAGSAQIDGLSGGDGDDFLNGGFASDRLNGGNGADRFYHAGATGHGSDWIQDFDSSEGDVLNFGISTATADDFNVTFTDIGGVAGVDEAFIEYIPTGQIVFALVDGGAESSIMMDILGTGTSFDLLA